MFLKSLKIYENIRFLPLYIFLKMVWVLIQIKNNNNLPCNFKIVVVKNTKNFDNILFNIDKILINSQILDVTFFLFLFFFWPLI